LRSRARIAPVVAVLLALAACQEAGEAKEAKATFERGVEALERGDLIPALRSFELIVETHPESSWAASSRQRIHDVRAKARALRDEALAKVEEAPEEARKDLHVVQAILHRDRRVLETLAKLAHEAGDVREAKDFAERLVRSYPDDVVDPWLHVLIARGHMAEYNPVVASEALDRAAEAAREIGDDSLVYLVLLEQFAFHERTEDRAKRVEVAEALLAERPDRAEDAGVVAFYRSVAVPYSLVYGSLTVRIAPEPGAPIVERVSGVRKVPVVFTREDWARVITPSGKLGFAKRSSLTNWPFAFLKLKARWIEVGQGRSERYVPAVGFVLRNTGDVTFRDMEVRAVFVQYGDISGLRNVAGSGVQTVVGRQGLAPGKATLPIVVRGDQVVTFAGPGEGLPRLGAELHVRLGGESEWRHVVTVVGESIVELVEP